MPYNAAVSAVPMPDRIAALPISDEGYPVPWFVASINGKPDFRVVDTPKLPRAVRARLCWVCGQGLGGLVASALGPMCTITRTISEPPSHRACVQFAMRACPFLANPRMRRNDKNLPGGTIEAPGFQLERNPGCMALWMSRQVTPFEAPGGVLFRVGDPVSVEWYCEGRPATRAEVENSITSGLPHLQNLAELDGAAGVRELRQLVDAAREYLPAA